MLVQLLTILLHISVSFFQICLFTNFINKPINLMKYNFNLIATACYGSDSAQFPTSNLFGAAGDGIWDNGAACGRQYQVRCISAFKKNTCLPDNTTFIIILDYAVSLPSDPSAPATTMVLSETAFGKIANSTATSINIEFQQ